MMTMLWVLFVALAGTHSGHGSPVRSTPPAYPHDASGPDWPEDWLCTLAAVAIVASFAGVLTGCIWCFRRKDLGELFTASATALHDGQRSQPPDSGFSETAAGEDNNNGPISFREMQNIENNNAAVYIAVETEARARSRESVIEFEPLPVPPAPPSPPPQRSADPLETCADWFGGEDIPRNSLQYLRECSRGWFGRVVEAELETDRGPRSVSTKVLGQAASLEDKARFLREARALRDAPHENLLAYVGKCLQEDPWTLVFEFCPMDLRTYLTGERSPAPAALSLAADAATALAHLHGRGYHGLAGALSSDSILVRDPTGTPRAVLVGHAAPPSQFAAPETTIPPHAHTASSEVWSLGVVVWEAMAGGAAPPACPAPPPAAPDPVQDHAYQVMQLCWQTDPASRATASQVAALLRALRTGEASAGGVDFEERWQRLKPNSIPKLDEHIALIHARAPSPPPRSESLTNLHGSLEDVRNIYLTHNETAAVDCHQGNIALEDLRDDASDPVDPWLKDIIAGSQDDVSYYRDVSDVIKNLDNILNSEKTSSSESSHQASPSRDNLSLDCKREYQSQSGLVKSPGISNFQNVLDMGFDAANDVEACEDEDLDQDTLGTLSHSFERHSDSTSQHTLENLTPGTPMNNIEAFENIVSQIEAATENNSDEVQEVDIKEKTVMDNECSSHLNDVTELPKENEVDCSDNNIPKLKDLCVASMPSLSEINEQFNVREDCEPTCANNVAETIRTDKEVETKSIDYTTSNINDTLAEEASNTNKTVEVEDMTEKIIEGNGDAHRSDIDKEISDQESNESTVYMDLIDDSNSKVVNEKPIDNNVTTVSDSCQNAPGLDSEVSLLTNESTVYLDLPSAVKDTKDFLQSERMNSSQHIEDPDEFCASTPKGSDRTADNTLEMNTKDKEVDLSETKVADCDSAVSVSKLELKQGSDNLSPFESPSKSHHTDTYEENSSVVLGPFENCTTDTYRLKTELVNLPKEELLAFSSNFSDIDLETPSPLRDSNFLNEVPDIIPDEFNFEDISERENRLSGDRADPQTDDTEETVDSGTAKHISPSTPPNSPGCFLASTSHQMYAVEVDLDSASGVPPPAPPAETDSGLSSLQKEIDLNQIEMTSNLAMAENENNLNMEYSGPLTVEGVVSEGGDVLPEAYLAGNAGLDAEPTEDCMQALRYELELKLPLAQVSGIEPAAESREEWALPPPPELVVSYCAAPPALSPIAEETGHQLHAYENDKWHTYTDSSESYLEPCNISTDEATELPTATTVGGPSGDGDGGEGPSMDNSNQETYTLQSRPTDGTYTLHQDVPTSNEMTMSADSLNGSPYKRPAGPPTPVDDRTYRVDEKEPVCEMISQVSPFLASPTTDASTPGPASTLTRTTDAKHSKPSECLSKTASIDSWCSNDTLYNVEENFDDLALEPEPPHSEATDTLTHDDKDEKDQDASHSSTYIVHDSKSDLCDTFSPDSMNANHNHTYTKGKTDATVTLEAKSDVNDSTKNTQTKDLAYGTLPSYSNCTTELISSFNDPLRLPRPELVRRSPVADEVDLTPPKMPEAKPIVAMDSPRTDEPSINKMSSVEITCLQDESVDSQNKSDGSPYREDYLYDSPKYNSNMAPSLTSTPILEPASCDDVPNFDSPEGEMTHIPNYQAFLQSAELRPQGLTPDSSDDGLTQAVEAGTAPEPSGAAKPALEAFPNYSDFENSANTKPQEVNSSEKSSQIESGASSGDFRQFANSLMSRPQDLTSLIDASSLFLHSERSAGEAVSPESSSRPTIPEQDSKPESNDAGPPPTQTPHIIVVEPPKDLSLSPEKSYDSHSNSKVNLDRTFDSHQETEFPLSYDSHTEVMNVETINNEVENVPEVKVNGSVEGERFEDIVNKATDVVNASIRTAEIKVQNTVKDLPNGSLSEDISTSTKDTITEVKCNGKSENFAIVNFLSEPYEELLESNVDEESKDSKTSEKEEPLKDVSLENSNSCIEEVQEDSKQVKSSPDSAVENEVVNNETIKMNGSTEHPRVAAVTEDFLQNEQKYCDLGSYLPLLSDIRFTGPASEIMSTSFSQESPTEANPPECEQDTKPDVVSEIVKEWDSDTESQSSNSSSGEFIWKDGDGRETALVPNTHFDHRDGDNDGESTRAPDAPADGGDSASGSGSGSGSEGDEVEFVPSSWDCRAAPAKSALRTLQAHSYTLPQDKKRVVFKRQKYHCVYEYPREVADAEHSPAACLPDFSTYCDWDPRAAEEAALGYGQLFGSPLDMYPLPQGIAFGSDYDDDFFISSSARPFESLGIMSTTSQFFPGMHVKPMLERRLSDDTEEFPPPPEPPILARPTPPSLPSLPSLDLTTPDSGVEDITPGSVADDDLKKVETTVWRGDSASSSESVSPSSPGGEALGGLRHTRDKLKLDLPPSPHVPSPRHSRVFSFALDKPRRADPPPEQPAEPSEPTFSTFGKTSARGGDAEQKIILTDSEDGADESENPEMAEAPEAPDAAPTPATKLGGPASDSGDEDSGIESSSKATLERNKTPHVS